MCSFIVKIYIYIVYIDEYLHIYIYTFQYIIYIYIHIHHDEHLDFVPLNQHCLEPPNFPPKKNINSYVQFIRMLGVDDPFPFWGSKTHIFQRGYDMLPDPSFNLTFMIHLDPSHSAGAWTGILGEGSARRWSFYVLKVVTLKLKPKRSWDAQKAVGLSWSTKTVFGWFLRMYVGGDYTTPVV